MTAADALYDRLEAVRQLGAEERRLLLMDLIRVEHEAAKAAARFAPVERVYRIRKCSAEVEARLKLVLEYSSRLRLALASLDQNVLELAYARGDGPRP